MRRDLGLPAQIAACLFDLDGVITQTARIHAQAWKRVFDEFHIPFEIDPDYATYVDGKPRTDGVRSVLAARHVPSSEGLVERIAGRKDGIFLDLIHRFGVQTYPGSIHYLNEVRKASLKVAVVSSSKHMSEVLGAAGIVHLF